MVSIARAEAGEEHLTFVRLAVTGGVAHMDEIAAVADVRAAMANRKYDCAFVIDDEHKLVGALRAGNLDDVPDSSELLAIDLCDQACHVVELDTTVEQLIPLCIVGDVPIAVVDSSQRLLGCVSRLSLASVLEIGELMAT